MGRIFRKINDLCLDILGEGKGTSEISLNYMNGHFVVIGSLNFGFLEGATAEILNTFRETVLVILVIKSEGGNICSYKSSSPVFPDSRERIFEK